MGATISMPRDMGCCACEPGAWLSKAKSAAEHLKDFEARMSGLLQVRNKHSNFSRMPTNILAQLLASNPQNGEFRVIPFTTLCKSFYEGAIGSMSYLSSTVPAFEIGEGAKVLFISHRWWSSPKAQPDQCDRGWPKARMILECIIPQMRKEYNCTSEQIFIWWDYFCVHQANEEVKQKQIASIPAIVASVDAVCAVRSGDEDFHSPDGPRIYDPKRESYVKYEGRLSDHSGHYNNRVWTAAELFVATSDFQLQFRGEPVPVYSVELDENYEPKTCPLQTRHSLRTRFHDARQWSMPPRSNLHSQEDVRPLEAMVAVLGGENIPHIVRAAQFGLSEALQTFIDSGADVNAAAPVTGETALHYAAGRHDPVMVSMLLAVPGIDVNKTNKLGRTALHSFVTHAFYNSFSFQHSNAKDCADMLTAAKADPYVRDVRGRTPLELHAMRNSNSNLFRQFGETVVNERKKQDEQWFYKVAGSANISYRTHEMPSGNVIAYRYVEPSGGVPPKDLVITFPTALCSSVFYVEFAVRMVMETGCAVVCLDLPGQGKSLIKKDNVQSWEDAKNRLKSFDTTEGYLDYYLEDLETVFCSQGWADSGAHFVANNGGSLSACHLAVKHPNWAKSVTFFGFAHAFRWPDDLLEKLLGLCDYLAKCTPEEHMAAMLPFAKPGLCETGKDLLRQCQTEEREQSTRMNVLTLFVSCNFKNVLDFPSLSMPVLLAPGELDEAFLHHSYDMAQRVPHAKISMVEGGGHYGPLENPGETATLVADFLSSLKHGRSSSHTSVSTTVSL